MIELLRINKTYAASILTKFVRSRTGMSFVLSFNLKCLLMRKKIRCYLDNTGYRVLENIPNGKKFSRDFCFERYGNKNYEYGFEERARRLEKAYMLNEKDFKPNDLIVDVVRFNENRISVLLKRRE
jgi:hypothetical protein